MFHKFYLFLLVCFSFPFVVNAAPTDIVDIPDPAFASCLNKTLDPARPADASITLAEMHSITTIACFEPANPPLSDLTGALTLVNLEFIYLTNHPYITDISDLRNSTKLIEIDFSGASVNDLSVLSHFPNLTYVDFYGNDVQFIENIPTLPYLDYFELAENPLRIRTDTELERYKELSANADYLGSSLPAPNDIVILEDIELRQCLFDYWIYGAGAPRAFSPEDDFTLTKSYVGAVDSLECYWYPITSLRGIEHFTSLSLLNVTGASFPSFPNLGALPNLSTVVFTYNNTSIFDEASVSNLPVLKSLTVQHNPFGVITPFKGLTYLSKLDIRNTGISLSTEEHRSIHQSLFNSVLTYLYDSSLGLPGSAVVFGDPLLRNCVNTALGRGVNNTNAVSIAQMETITYFYCERAFTNISGLEYAKNITGFEVYNANLSTLPDLRPFKKVQNIHFENSRITRVNPLHVSHLPNLLTLNLVNNRLTDFSFVRTIQSSPLLTEIYVHNNTITSLPSPSELSDKPYTYFDVQNNPIVLRTNQDVSQHNQWLRYASDSGKTFRYNYSRGLFQLDNVSLSATRQTVNMNTNQHTAIFSLTGGFRFTDTRDDVSGNSLAGWRIQASLTDFTNGVHSFSKNNAYLKNLQSIAVEGVSAPSDERVPLGSAVTILSAESGEGGGIYDIDFSAVQVEVEVPIGTPTGEYTSTLTLQRVSGP